MRKDNDYIVEERDDPRTTTGELIPDCEKEDGESFDLPILEYLCEFRALVDACGQVSYYMNMKKCIMEKVSKAVVVAAAYQHDLRYYEEQYNGWRFKARRSYNVLSVHAKKLGYEMPNLSSFLNAMTFSKDRRDAYRDYLDTCLKNSKTISPREMEKKFQLRLKKRTKK